MESYAGSSMLTMLITFFVILSVPAIILNVLVAKRKGKSRALFGWLSVIPYLGYLLLFYLISLPDEDMTEKIDRILAILEKQ
jgi:hypothetical protein